MALRQAVVAAALEFGAGIDIEHFLASFGNVTKAIESHYEVVFPKNGDGFPTLLWPTSSTQKIIQRAIRVWMRVWTECDFAVASYTAITPIDCGFWGVLAMCLCNIDVHGFLREWAALLTEWPSTRPTRAHAERSYHPQEIDVRGRDGDDYGEIRHLNLSEQLQRDGRIERVQLFDPSIKGGQNLGGVGCVQSKLRGAAEATEDHGRASDLRLSHPDKEEGDGLATGPINRILRNVPIIVVAVR